MAPPPDPPAPAVLSQEDLAAYLERIHFPTKPAVLRPDTETLKALHRAHVLAIPFENLSIHIGGPGEMPIRLDLPSLMDKLVRRKRGGYCFEQNSLFGAALRAVGFKVEAYEARVRLGTKSLLPRTHMVLGVGVGEGMEARVAQGATDREFGEGWLCDVGFGGDGLYEPVPFSGAEVDQALRTYRAVDEDDGRLKALQVRGSDGWSDLYAFEPRAVAPIDLEVANWYTSTYPESAFVRTLTAQRVTPEARYLLRGKTYSVVRGEEAVVREAGVEEVPILLQEIFTLDSGK